MFFKNFNNNTVEKIEYHDASSPGDTVLMYGSETYVNIMWYKFIRTFITYNLSSKTIIIIFIILIFFLIVCTFYFSEFFLPKKNKINKLKNVNELCTFKSENLNVSNHTITYYLHISQLNFFCTVVNYTVRYIISYDTLFLTIHSFISTFTI